jgi:hypothetical protein
MTKTTGNHATEVDVPRLFSMWPSVSECISTPSIPVVQLCCKAIPGIQNREFVLPAKTCGLLSRHLIVILHED